MNIDFLKTRDIDIYNKYIKKLNNIILNLSQIDKNNLIKNIPKTYEIICSNIDTKYEDCKDFSTYLIENKLNNIIIFLSEYYPFSIEDLILSINLNQFNTAKIILKYNDININNIDSTYLTFDINVILFLIDNKYNFNIDDLIEIINLNNLEIVNTILENNNIDINDINIRDLNLNNDIIFFLINKNYIYGNDIAFYLNSFNTNIIKLLIDNYDIYIIINNILDNNILSDKNKQKYIKYILSTYKVPISNIKLDTSINSIIEYYSTLEKEYKQSIILCKKHDICLNITKVLTYWYEKFKNYKYAQYIVKKQLKKNLIINTSLKYTLPNDILNELLRYIK
jgi:hypothetical protein